MRIIESANLHELLGKADILEEAYTTYDDDKIDSFDNEGRQICRLYHKQTMYSRFMLHTLVDAGSIPATSTKYKNFLKVILRRFLYLNR